MDEVNNDVKREVNDHDYDNWADNLIPMIFFGLCIYYTINNRQLEDYKYIVLILGVISSALVVSQVYQNNKLETLATLLGISLFLILLAPFTGMMFYSIFVCFYDAAIYLYKISNEYWRIILPAIFSLAAGYSLFLFRQKKRVLYGFSEVMVGVMVGVLHGQRVLAGQSGLGSPDFYIAVLTASIYLIVRGFDNMSLGLKSMKEKT